MKNKLKFISIILATMLVITPLFNSFNNNNLSALANNAETTIQIDEEEIESNNIFVIAAVITIISEVGHGLIEIDNRFFRAHREQWNKIKNTYNGWVSLNGTDGRTLWFLKDNGGYKKGWHWDTYYNGYYYFYGMEFVVGDPNFSKVRWNANVMFDPANNGRWIKIGNKWFEFEVGGKLIHYEGWRQYGDRWLYHLPGNYGAVADGGLYIDGTWYNFDSSGYWIP